MQFETVMNTFNSSCHYFVFNTSLFIPVDGVPGTLIVYLYFKILLYKFY